MFAKRMVHVYLSLHTKEPSYSLPETWVYPGLTPNIPRTNCIEFVIIFLYDW